VVGASDEGTGGDFFESHVKGGETPLFELFRGHIPIDRKVFFGRAQVLTEGEHAAA